MMGTFQLEGQQFYALNGGPTYSFTPAISLYVNCETQEEIDRLWDKLVEGGRPQQCGWLTDRYGLSWQIVPSILGRLMQDTDPQKRGKVMQVVMQTVKFDIAALQAASDGA
jgi:predicted 3-demethylubiquinone-9 3-methyltransferase (glyoxalase superfamily)